MKNMLAVGLHSLLLHNCPSKVEAIRTMLPLLNENQQARHEMGKYAFVHFATNTFTCRKWRCGEISSGYFR